VSRARLVAALALGLGVAARAAAQEFAPPEPAGPGGSPGGFLEYGLPPAAPAAALEAAFTSWFGLPELETRALSAGTGYGALRAAAGVAQMGARDIGWDAAALAGGVVVAGGGAGLRAVARRDRAIPPGSAAAASLGARAGVEAGWGAWVAAGRGLTLWATVPQTWVSGTAPPLERPLEIGARYEPAGGARGLALWLSRAAPSAGGAPDHGAGLSLAAGPLLAWAAARDRPLRAGVGLAAAGRLVRVAAVVESHPDLGETVRLSLGLGRSAR
jgi:hypothetical protein